MIMMIVINIIIVFLSLRHRREATCARACVTTTGAGRRHYTATNSDHEISPSALQNARRAGGNPTARCVVAVETCDIPLPGGDTEVFGRIERERGVLARRQWPFAGVCMRIRRATSTLNENNKNKRTLTLNTGCFLFRFFVHVTITLSRWVFINHLLQNSMKLILETQTPPPHLYNIKDKIFRCFEKKHE